MDKMEELEEKGKDNRNQQKEKKGLLEAII